MFQADLLHERAIFLTGGGSGLGKSMALQFAKLGAKLFIVGRREEPLKETVAEIEKAGGAAGCATCDVRDYAAVEAALDAATAKFGAIDSPLHNSVSPIGIEHEDAFRIGTIGVPQAALGHGLRGNKDPSSDELILERFLFADGATWNQRKSEHHHRRDNENATPIHRVPPPDHSKGSARCNKSGALVCGT